ncbi:MAG: hypothetical protein EPN14_01895 [Gallionella sp.]|nr:MAG: hypothetical protein EPN14_01895 [Gallionella sp.]
MAWLAFSSTTTACIKPAGIDEKSPAGDKIFAVTWQFTLTRISADQSSRSGTLLAQIAGIAQTRNGSWRPRSDRRNMQNLQFCAVAAQSTDAYVRQGLIQAGPR